ncbi:hypothetical protein AB1A81_13180 [Bdellovibrio bacteriovorus]|uniref:Uncharacterized protein n=1 Tax=Bdellovibrio bacteriovorus (strain ATCC 15356 / DSM 50701 / NCIMB 9529 / HD100) TaxID=264462 RepID=Q6MJB0_BDEBA|nr:hypothetical protein [Bdellovibrio bacteriovorus]CAE80651.1 hypothetical protein predicted by Glimmer/Critica [Bdellovibrio bacteriovorus HD100]
MSIRNVIFIIAGTVAISVISVVLTLRLTQTKTDSHVVPAAVSTELPQQQTPSLPKASQQPAPPPAKPSVAPQVAKQESSPSLEAFMKPAAFKSGPAEQKPLSTDKVISTLMKDTPACHDEYKEHCTANRFLAEHPLACLRSKKDQLSRACFNQLAAVRDRFHQACGTDIKRFCTKEASYFVCLKQHMDDLSASCKNNIEQSSRQ